MSERPQALIIGAGPTGLIMVHALAREGIACRLIDKTAHRAMQSRAIAIHSRTLETFELMGIIDEFLAGSQGPAAGARAPDAPLEKPDGAAALRLYDLIAAHNHVLLLTGGASDGSLAALPGYSVGLSAYRIASPGMAAGDLIDCQGTVAARFGSGPATYLIARMVTLASAAVRKSFPWPCRATWRDYSVPLRLALSDPAGVTEQSSHCAPGGPSRYKQVSAEMGDAMIGRIFAVFIGLALGLATLTAAAATKPPAQKGAPACGALRFRALPSGMSDGEQQAGMYQSRFARIELRAEVKQGAPTDYFVTSGGKRLAAAPASLPESAVSCATAKKMPAPGNPASPCTGQSFTVVLAHTGSERLALLYAVDGSAWRFCSAGTF